MSGTGKRDDNPSAHHSSQDGDGRHETARQTTGDALGAYAKGDQEKGDELAEKARQMDSTAVQEVIDDLDEDAGSDRSVPGKAGSPGSREESGR